MKKRYLGAILLVIASLLLSACGLFDLGLGNPQPPATTENGITEVPLTGEDLLKVTFIDVGQGDSSFIEFPGGECMLIDAAEREESHKVINYIKKAGYKKIDHLVVTHPHSDHMGGMVKVIEEFEIGRIYMTNAVNNTSSFDELLDSIEDNNIPLTQSKAGVGITRGEDFEAVFLSPISEEYEDLNNYSSVVKLTYKSKVFLFMGDAEKLVEKELGDSVACDVVKIGHHGSSTSSGAEFVKNAGADYGIISVAQTNKYGHPNSGVVDRFVNAGTLILRTDKSGNIIFITDGEGFNIRTEKGEAPDTYEVPVTPESTSTHEEYHWILNTKTMKVHKLDCSSATTMKEENKEYSAKNLEDLLAAGYTLCGVCDPEE